MSKQAHDRSRANAQCARAAIASLLVAVCGLLPSLAHAGPNDGPPRRDNQQQQQQRRDSQWGDGADARSFEARAEEQRRIMQENASNAEISRRMSRMTPDERRDLRRQINDARIEVYSNPPRR
ncbi:hypothetical protein [Pseudoduganella lutea]|uniref:hypothetical protein n=1 Tax=Pseudoduganella lutea TaxID=321985 RepID=UPI001E347DFE|nr:hypothetical protein [Pseudoduganella lutea]